MWRWFVKVVSPVGVFACFTGFELGNSVVGYNFAGGGGGQVFLLPPDPREWLPPQHLAWAVRRAVAGLDLAPFVVRYRADGQGRTAYHPAMMVALVVSCYCKGIGSSRAIEMATSDDVGARGICGGLHPGHAANARFVTRHQGPLEELLAAEAEAWIARAAAADVAEDALSGGG